jgi:hypothetical protein
MINFNILQPALYRKLQDFAEEVSYNKDEIIVHKGHVPRICIIYVEQVLFIYNKCEETITGNYEVGFTELLYNQKLKFTLKAYRKSRIKIITKSMLLSFKYSKDKVIKEFYNNLLKAK